MTKTYIVLKMFDKINNGDVIRLKQFCDEYRVSLSTFRRYMAVLKTYFWEEHRRVLEYDRVHDYYLLKM